MSMQRQAALIPCPAILNSHQIDPIVAIPIPLALSKQRVRIPSWSFQQTWLGHVPDKLRAGSRSEHCDCGPRDEVKRHRRAELNELGVHVDLLNRHLRDFSVMFPSEGDRREQTYDVPPDF